MRIINKNIIIYKIYWFWVNYFSPSNFNYWWNFGSISFIFLFLQIFSGIFLAMHYKSDFLLAFASVDYISREIQYGWLIRYMHSNGASLFFIAVYLHIIRGFMYGSFSYPRQLLWSTGIVIFVLMIITAFLGYVLPWGQMSFWAATVITSLFTAVPFLGNELVIWLWGGYSVDDATLNRFYSLHYFLPFLILALTIFHLMLLHEFGSNNPIGLFFKMDGIPMMPYYIIKDLYGTIIIIFFFIFLIFFFPNYLGHSDNFILGNPLITPNHIVPEWYFLPLYAILRSIPDKLLGVIVMILAIMALLFFPFIVNKFILVRSLYFKPFLKLLIIFFIINCIILGWIGGQPVIQPYYFIGQLATQVYFFLFILFYFISLIENKFLIYYIKFIKC